MNRSSLATAIRAPAAGFPLKPWAIPAVLAGLAVPLLLWGSSLLIVAVQGTPENLSTGEVVANLVATIVVLDGALVAAPIIVAFWRYRLSWGALGFRSAGGAPWWLPPAAAATAYVLVVLYLLVLLGFGVETSQDVQDFFDDRALLPLAAFALLVVAPFAEELFFRGFVFAGLVRPIGLYAAIIVSGLLFGAIHINDAGSALRAPAIAGIGMLLAWVYWKTGSLWFSIATHFLFNLVSFAILAGGG